MGGFNVIFSILPLSSGAHAKNIKPGPPLKFMPQAAPRDSDAPSVKPPGAVGQDWVFGGTDLGWKLEPTIYSLGSP